jgi:Bifunctional DNA primase/polymerase, N-terminal
MTGVEDGAVMQSRPVIPEYERALVAALRMAALEYATEGWPIVALNQRGDRLVARMSPLNPSMAADWWSQRPYGIGVRVGELFDVIEMPASVGGLLRAQFRAPIPVFDVPLRGWFVLVSPGSPCIPELAPYRQLVRLHRRGAWLPLPPTRLAGGPALWVSRGQIPHSLVVQTSLLPALRQMLTDTTRSERPRSPMREGRQCS